MTVVTRYKWADHSDIRRNIEHMVFFDDGRVQLVDKDGNPIYVDCRDIKEVIA